MKNFKRILSLLMAFVLVLGTVTIVSADREFSDLSANHWAYANVQTLVADGTINGYQDGTFRPDAGVTRAEFVKMIGKTDKVFDVPFDDITGHWAYDYIMYSDMDVEGTSFRPDSAMTRDDIVALLWKRAGSPVAYAPGIITSQSKYPNAAAWAYAYGIMNGDDGITMRYSDGVTRAEAAALICRSRTVNESSKKEFADTVDPRLLEEVYEAFPFLGEYDPDRTFTNGELTFFALQLLYDTQAPLYDEFYVDFDIERPYGLAFTAICNSFWGDSKKTYEYYDAKANNLNAVALITFAIGNKSFKPILDKVDGELYADVTTIEEGYMEQCVSAAHANDIRIDCSDNIYPEKELTGKNLALILLQCDMLGGFSTSYVNSLGVEFPVDTHIRTKVNSYPKNADDYQYILEEIPNVVYESKYVDVDGSASNKLPKDSYYFTHNFTDIFAFSLDDYTYKLYNNGVDAIITYYPSLVCETDRGYIMKVKVLVNAFETGKTFDDVFPNTISGTKPELKPGQIFYATLATGAKFDGTSIPLTNAKFTTIDHID